MGALTKQQGFDPLSVTLYKDDQLPAGRYFVEPHVTGHLFVAHFEPGVKR